MALLDSCGFGQLLSMSLNRTLVREGNLERWGPPKEEGFKKGESN
jgi:hypothetical protein